VDIQKISDDFKEIKKKWGKEGKDFNFFQFIEDKFWKITETKHSRILAFFLDPNEIHGQGGEFLKLFLRRLGFDVSNFNAEKWEIYVEKDNIDILLQSDTISIVIENKSNGAANQEHQLYRYWVNGIYHFHHKDIEKAEKKICHVLFICQMVGRVAENLLDKPKNAPIICLLMDIQKD
jgi:ankyrin repeat containing protein